MPEDRRAEAAHAGQRIRHVDLAERTMASMPGAAPILVDSAGCGAAMKEYGRLVGTPEAEAFSARVFDANEFLAEHADRLPVMRPVEGPLIVQDPCHLRHVQGVHGSVRELLAPLTELIELDDAGLCCGAGGAYSAVEPELASDIRDRKVAAIERAVRRSGSSTVVSANPGCSMHLEGELRRRGITVRHPIDVLAAALP